ncbi:MAG: hypothetical protein ABFD82_18390 [Syntrophaceae bacterium]
MDKDKKVGLAVNIIVTITLFIVCVYLGFHFYNTGMETGFRKGRVAGWNTGYREGQESMMEVIKEVQTRNRFSGFDQGDIDRKLTDIEMKLDEAEWQRKFGK